MTIIDAKFEQIDTNEDITPPVELPQGRAGNRQHAKGVDVANKAIAKTDPADINIGRLHLTAVGISGQLAKPPTVDEFRAAISLIGRASGASNWWVGDLANHADNWGDEYVQMLDGLGLEYEFIRDCAWVAHPKNGVAFSTRVDALSWSHHKAIAALTSTEQRRWLKRAQPKEGETTPRLSVRELKKAIRQDRIEKERQKNPLPDDTYRVIYADPPWKYNDERQHTTGAAVDHYPVMSVEEICNLHDATGQTVKDLSQPSSVLFLWATVPMLPEAMAVMSAWGFAYKTHLVWLKGRGYYGHYFDVRHEVLLLGTRGSCVPETGQLHPSDVAIDRSKIHSQKPDRFYEIIESMYTDGPYLELFARKTRKGWDAWGNEASR